LQRYRYLAESVSYQVRGSKVILVGKDNDLQLIGEGRSAFAFKIHDSDKVLKVFFPSFENIASQEAGIYHELSRNRFFPVLHESGSNYLVMDHVQGTTLFNCLVEGTPITRRQISEVDAALQLARAKGLNPSDIHLRNIIVTPDGSVKLIDVARFRQTKKCTQWDDLKTAFNKFYSHRLFPKKVPEFVINLIAFFYKKGLLPSLNRIGGPL
jgi:predicted Ser/Thr protein kinase